MTADAHPNFYRACWAQEAAPMDGPYHWMPDRSNTAICGESIRRVAPRIGMRLTSRHCQACHGLLEKERAADVR